MSVAVAETGNVAGELALDRLVADHWPNPRGPVDTTSPAFAELKASIAEQGILEPIVVGPPLLELDGRHAIVAGWRRYTAAAALGLPTVPIHQRIDITNAHLALRAALAENMAREQMTPLAEASAIARLVELGDTQVQAAAYVGVSERTARERLRLLDLPKAVKDAIDAGHVPTTCTRQLQLIADVAPAAASAIAERIAKGAVQAQDLIEPTRLYVVLRDLETKQAPLVELSYRASLKALGLPSATLKDLTARSKKAAEYSYDGGDTIDFSPAAIGKKFLDEAREAGKVLTIPRPPAPDAVYLADKAWVERAATASIEKLERAAKRRTAEQQRLRAGREAEPASASEPTDPRARAEAERDVLAAAIDSRAQPHAVAMNAEIGARLRALTTVRIDGPVARLLLHLLGSPLYLDEVARFGYELVDPSRSLADDWARRRDPSKGAAEIVAALVAAGYADPRASDKKTRRSSYYARDLPLQLLGEVARGLKLLPDRAIALAAAREVLAEQLAYHDLRGTRRRLLHELTTAPAGKLEYDALWTAGKAWGRNAGDLPDIDMQISFKSRFDPALEQLVDAGHVKKIGKNAYAITADGRADLQTVPAPAPVIKDIDASEDPPDGGGSATDEPQDDANDLIAKLAPGSRRTKLLELVAAHPGSTIPELAEGIGIKQNYLYRLLPELAEDGLVRKDGRGWHPAPAPEATS